MSRPRFVGEVILWSGINQPEYMDHARKAARHFHDGLWPGLRQRR